MRASWSWNPTEGRKLRLVPTVNINGIDLYHEQSGSGPRLLFLNGSGSTLETSELLIDVFRSRFDVVAHDQRGLGRTEIPPGPYSMADYAADALALLDVVGWTSCRVVGVSFGGMVAQELAVTASDRVERLALVCTSPGGSERSSYPLHELSDLPEHERAAIAVKLLDTRFDAWDRLPTISCPTLVAGGRFDGIAPPANSEAIARQVPRADLRLYGGGHAFFAQDSRALPEILDFVAG